MSDLKITHAGSEITRSATGPINPLATLGQDGSVYTNLATAITPPTGKVFVAITFLAETQFHDTDGLVAEDGTKFINEAAEAHGGTADSLHGTGGVAVDNGVKFPGGLTIYGRWTKITMKTADPDGGIIAYIG